MTEEPRNLDHEAALAAQAILDDPGVGPRAKSLENVLRRTAAILQEQGIYAAILYLHAKEKDLGAPVAKHLLHLCVSIAGGELSDDAKPTAQLAYLTERVTNNISNTLLVRHIWEQTLVYGIYHCKTF